MSDKRAPRLSRAFTGGLLLLLMVLLNAAVVVPALHQLWHADADHDHDHDHGCGQPDCVVLALAHGKVDAAAPVAPDLEPMGVPVQLAPIPLVMPAVRLDWSEPLGRGPPFA